MSPDEMMPGQFVKVRYASMFGTGWAWLRWVGHVDGSAIVEDAVGNRAAVSLESVFAFDHVVAA